VLPIFFGVLPTFFRQHFLKVLLIFFHQYFSEMLPTFFLIHFLEVLPTFFHQHFLEVLLTFFLNIFRKCRRHFFLSTFFRKCWQYFFRQHFLEVLISSTIFSQYFYKMLQPFFGNVGQLLFRVSTVFTNVGLIDMFSSTFFKLLKHFLEMLKKSTRSSSLARPVRAAPGAPAGEPRGGSRTTAPGLERPTRGALAGSGLPPWHQRRRAVTEEAGLAGSGHGGACRWQRRPARERRRQYHTLKFPNFMM
jgi:hypothetical protein